MLKQTSPMDAHMTSLSGYVDTTYTALVEAFGEPGPGDEYKIDAEWTLKDDETGQVVTVYNYKDGLNYNGPDGTPVEYITEWHVGGHKGAADVETVLAALKDEDEDLTDDDGYPVTPSPLV